MGKKTERVPVSRKNMLLWIIVLTIAVGILLVMNVYWGVQVSTILGEPRG